LIMVRWRIGLLAGLAVVGFILTAVNTRRIRPAAPPISPAGAHKYRAEAYSREGNYDAAESELRTAAQLDPNDSDIFLQLGVVYQNEGQMSRAVEAYDQALQKNPRSPYRACLYAGLAFADARQGNTGKAHAEAKEAESLIAPGESSTEQLLWEAYDTLREPDPAIEHCKKALAYARRSGGDSNLITATEAFLAKRELMRTPVYFTNAPPRDYRGDEWERAVRQKVSPDELPTVVNPLTSSAGIKVWARELTAGATNDLQKAGILCHTLALHQGMDPSPRTLTAPEVFAAWKTKGASFLCVQLSCLYVALAREAGLKAYCASVERSWDGKWYDHMCAAVFTGEGMLLVDPTFDWLGVPHQKFTVLDDVQTAGEFLCGGDNLQHARIACKLEPDSPLAHANVFDLLTNEQHRDEARSEMAELKRLDPDGPNDFYARGVMAEESGEIDQALELLARAIKLAPDMWTAYLRTGICRARQGRPNAARIAFQNGLRRSSDREARESARILLASLDSLDADTYLSCGRQADQQRDWDEALGDFSRALDRKPDCAEGYCGYGRAIWGKGDPDSALLNFDKAIGLKSDCAEAFEDRGVLMQARGDLDRAFSDYTKSLSINPSRGPALAPGFSMMGCLHYDQRQFGKAAADFRKACELMANDDHSHFRLWLARSRMGETTAATRELREYLDTCKSTNSTTWPAAIGAFLTGRVSEPDFLAFAGNLDPEVNAAQRCRAYFYAGAKRLISGDKENATAYFKKSVAAKATSLSEYASAVAELGSK